MINEKQDELIMPWQFMGSLLPSRLTLLEEILTKLEDDQVGVVALLGMPGSGKTMLIKEIITRLEAKERFDRIVKIDVSKAIDIKSIQNQIALQIDLHFMDIDNMEQRAIKLYEKLKEKQIHDRSKTFLFLDNIRGKLDLGKVIWVPKLYPNSNDFSFKILLASRTKSVLQVLGVPSVNIFELELLVEAEARKIFTEQMVENMKTEIDNKRDILDTMMMKYGEKGQEVVKKLLRNCKGEPLAIVALANVLKNKDFSIWEHFAIELSKQNLTQCTISSEYFCTYSILEIVYKNLENDDKRKFLLLASLFPSNLSIPIQDMIICGIGLGLFHVNSLTQAIKQANTWIEEFKSSCLLLEGDYEDYICVSDIVRDCLISFGNKGDFMIIKDNCPRWWDNQTYQNYNAITLSSFADHSHLNTLRFKNLRVFILNASKPQGFSDTFFKRMKYLKVLILKGMVLNLEDSTSIRELKSTLRTLQLEGCNVTDLTGIQDLVNLLVLSLRESNLKSLSADLVKNFHKLSILDLSACKITSGRIPTDILTNLSHLEGFYAFDLHEVEGKYGTKSKFPFIDMTGLTSLKVVELQINLKTWATQDDVFVKNLDQFYILIGGTDTRDQAQIKKSQHNDLVRYSRILEIISEDIRSVMKHKSFIVLLQKTESLRLLRCKGFQLLENVPNLLDIKLLTICEYQEVDECFILTRFPNLQKLILKDMYKLEPYALSLHLLPCNLTHLYVEMCPNLSFIFKKDDPIDTSSIASFYGLPSLKTLGLHNNNKLKNMYYDAQGGQALFNTKLIFPSLEEVILHTCDEIVTLWDFRCNERYYISNLKNLKKVTISKCKKLESLGPFLISDVLVQLKELVIGSCPKLREVFIGQYMNNSTKKSVEIQETLLLFPSLKTILLEDCKNLKRFLSPNQNCTIEFSALESLKIIDCPNMECFTSQSLRSPKLKRVEVDSNKYIMHDIVDVNELLHHRYQKGQQESRSDQWKTNWV